MSPVLLRVARLITFAAIALAGVFWVLTFVGWLRTDPGFEPVNVLVSAILSSLIAMFGYLRARSVEAKIQQDAEVNVKNSINSLDDHEKAVLREFFLQDRNTVLMPIDDPVVAGLLQKNIISKVDARERMSRNGRLFPVSLSPLVSTLVRGNPQIVNYPDKPTQEQIEEIRNSQPSFMRETEPRFPRVFG